MSISVAARQLRKLLSGLTVAVCCMTAHAQQACTNGARVEGRVIDPTGAVIRGATVQVAGVSVRTDAAGLYVIRCIRLPATLAVRADGFAGNAVPVRARPGSTVTIDIPLAVASVATDVQVTAQPDNDSGSDTTNLSTQQVQQMADDPDDFLREIQVLAAQAGGDPTTAMIMVDGFQNGSAMPPKSSIASIRINPDLFSSKYQSAPWSGGLIEITTKPGADTFHGAVFFSDSDSSFNANDPFSVAATPAGKRRYGFELSGPLVANKSGFALALEKRDIDEYNVVNAITLDVDGSLGPGGDGVAAQQSIAAPERLWIASARADWQVTANDVASLSFAANVNNEENQGVGGLTLADAGYASTVGEYDLRFHNAQTISPDFLHETRIGYTWKRTAQTPLLTAPSVEVAGYFLGGGAISQDLNNRERDLEMDEEASLTHGAHTLAFGVQSLGLFVHNYDPNTFNGAYVFGGGSAPVLDANSQATSETTTISALEQYRRALLGLPGGSPTTYQLTSGNPLVPLAQWRVGMYAQDTIKLARHLTLDAGLRYQFQTTPETWLNFDPRIGLAWTIDRKETWVAHARLGFFSSTYNPSNATEVYRLNGVRQSQVEVYSPNYVSPLTPVPGSVSVSTINLFAPSMVQPGSATLYVNLEHDFPHHWHARANLYFGEGYNSIRLVNINAPMVASSIGVAPDPTAALQAPRPIASDVNMMEYENNGHASGSVASISLDQHSYKRFWISTRYAHYSFKTNVLTSMSPQSSYSNLGETGPEEWASRNTISLNGNVILPFRIEASTEFDAGQGHPYNITTGTDNNGDGVFTDRPAYATATGPGVYATRFGLLTTNTVNGNVPANIGTMPGAIHLDVNLSRAFRLGAKNKEEPRTLTFSARSANLLNHTNVTAVNSVLSSSLGQSVAAETARRMELGARFSF